MIQVDTTQCSSCGAVIFFGRTDRNSKWMPLDAKPERRFVAYTVEGDPNIYYKSTLVYIPHWATCPNADQHRRKDGG